MFCSWSVAAYLRALTFWEVMLWGPSFSFDLLGKERGDALLKRVLITLCALVRGFCCSDEVMIDIRWWPALRPPARLPACPPAPARPPVGRRWCSGFTHLGFEFVFHVEVNFGNVFPRKRAIFGFTCMHRRAGIRACPVADESIPAATQQKTKKK